MKALLGTSFLLVILSPAVPLKCIYTTDITKDSNKRVEDCEPGLNVCISSVFRSNIAGDKEAAYYGCGVSVICYSGNYSFTSASGKYLEIITRCCNTDLCNNETIPFPDRNNLRPRCLKCPACYHNSDENCTSEETIDCYGNENQCISFEGHFLTTSTVMTSKVDALKAGRQLQRRSRFNASTRVRKTKVRDSRSRKQVRSHEQDSRYPLTMNFKGCATTELCSIMDKNTHPISSISVDGNNLFAAKVTCYGASENSYQPEF